MSNAVSQPDLVSIRVMKRALQVLQLEQNAIQKVAEALDEHFSTAVDTILKCSGRICFTGFGKAGLVALKVQATFASTGTLGYFLHPTEALHGDIGMVSPADVVIALSKSGGAEIAEILAVLRPRVASIILVTACPHGPASKFAQTVLSIGDSEEACPLKLAPSSSTTAMLALGDALAFGTMEERGFAPSDYARLHPAGSLGRALLQCKEVMRTGEDCPRVRPTNTLQDCLAAMQAAPKRAGCVVVVETDGAVLGIITQGDLVRKILAGMATSETAAAVAMTTQPKTIRQDALASEALQMISLHLIDELPVVDARGHLAGLIDVQDLVARGFSLER